MQPTATITINRTSDGYRDRMRAYKVIFDGAPAGSIKLGESIIIPVTPGAHTVQLKLDWCTSPTLTISAQPGTDTTLRCAPGGSALTALLHMLRPGAYITLENAAARGQ